nr:galactokinase [Desulfobacterales bacterium]
MIRPNRATQHLSGITAAILAGGLGTRLRSVVSDRPKVLAEVRGRPFLSYLLDQLAAAGIRYVVLCIGYLGEQVKAEFGNTYGGLHLVYSQESSPIGTAGALRWALPLFESDPVLVMNGDSFCQVELRDFFSWHLAQNANASLVLTEVRNMQRYGRVNVDVDGHVLSFVEKDERSGPGWINAGIYLINRRLLLTIPESGGVSLEEEMFPAWIDQGLYGYRSKGRFLDIGTPETYGIAEEFVFL